MEISSEKEKVDNILKEAIVHNWKKLGIKQNPAHGKEGIAEKIELMNEGLEAILEALKKKGLITEFQLVNCFKDNFKLYLGGHFFEIYWIESDRSRFREGIILWRNGMRDRVVSVLDFPEDRKRRGVLF